MRKLLLALVAGAALVAAAPAVAAADDWAVFAGPPTKAPKTVPKTAEFDNFYPGLLRVHEGDRVVFSTTGFHTITFLGSHDRSEFLSIVTTPHKYQAFADKQGKPFWWAGLTKFEYGTKLAVPAGTDVVLNDTDFHNALISPDIKRPRATFTFTKEGTYKFVCLLHPYMQGEIVVKPRSEDIPNASQVNAAAGRHLGGDWLAASRLVQSKPKLVNTVYAGVGTHRVSVNSFLPATMKIKANSTVTWIVRSPAQQHDEAWGPRPYLNSLIRKTDFFPFGRDKRNQVSPFFLFGTDEPPLFAYDGGNHGNGTLITGMQDQKAGSCLGCSSGVVLPGRARVKFTKPGVYRYVCLLHAPEMVGTIIVTR